MIGEGNEESVVRHQKSPSQQHRKEDQERGEREAHKVWGSLSRGSQRCCVPGTRVISQDLAHLISLKLRPRTLNKAKLDAYGPAW
jgi:hypothetical protein